MLELVQHLINGLSLGSIYALIALGYTMVFGILQLINFAHGEVYMLGAFAGYYFSKWTGVGHEPSLGAFLLTLIFAMAFCACVGFIIERFAYRPLRGAPRLNSLITAVGVSFFLQYAGQLTFGSDPKFFPQLYSPGENWVVWGLNVNPLQVTALIVSLVLMLLLHRVIFHTRLGRGMRAVSFNHELASLMGIPTNRVISATFMLGSALAGAAGVLVGLVYPKIEPLMGTLPGLKAFVSAVLGGIGNVTGALVGGLTLGVSESLVVGYLSSTYRDAIAFIILIVILLVRPSGLLGKQVTEKV